MAKMQCVIVSPEEEKFNKEVDYIDAPGISGEFGVLCGHEPFLTTLKIGIVKIRSGESDMQSFLVIGGYFQVEENKVIVIADEIYAKEDVNLEDAKRKADEFKNKLDALKFTDENYDKTKQKYDKYKYMAELAS